MRRVLIAVLAAAGSAALMPGGALAARAQAEPNAYVVLYGSDVSTAAARLAVRTAGGTIVNENADVGVATVWSLSPTFLADVMKQPRPPGEPQRRSASKRHFSGPRIDRSRWRTRPPRAADTRAVSDLLAGLSGIRR